MKALTLAFCSDRLEQILNQVSKAIISTPNPTGLIHEPTWGLLFALTTLENHPSCLTELAYQWCPVIWERFGDWARLFLLPLKIGFRHLDSSDRWIQANLTHVNHNQSFLDTVFKTSKIEAIADLLQALTVKDRSGEPARISLRLCTSHIVDLHNRVPMPFSPRLRRLVARSVEFFGREGFEEGGAGKFVWLLNHLCIGVEDMDWPYDWTSILVEIIQSAEGIRHLDIKVWELLAKLATSYSRALRTKVTYDPRVTRFLLESEEWEKLECWLGVVWMAWLPETDDETEDLNSATNLLFRQKPDSVRKLTQWMEEWSEDRRKAIPVPFQEICEQALQDAS